ncbi:unnamed protein product [Echinostoma caproni]|uniref:RPA_interact_C domain-containing protein n=1 Tax=Echinostoma caproni TaxID=27848 RepID=A0A183BB30_9TREM|nr:unnamed protein product [Echinostoma caproni]
MPCDYQILVLFELHARESGPTSPKEIIRVLHDHCSQSIPSTTLTHHECDLLRTLSELNCLYAESLDVLLRCQPCGAKLGVSHTKFKLPPLEDAQNNEEIGLDLSQDSLRGRRQFQRQMEEGRRAQMWFEYGYVQISGSICEFSGSKCKMHDDDCSIDFIYF